MRALAERVRASDDLRDLVGDRSLTCTVVAGSQLAQELGSVIRRCGHGGHTRAMLPGLRIGHAAMDLTG